MMIKILHSKPILTIIITVLLMLGFGIHYLDVSIMEARNFITAREMITDNHWLLTSMNGEARYEKPPLPTWLSALSAFVFGIKNVFAYRLPAIIMVMILGIGAYLLSLKLVHNKTHALINALIAITSFYVIAIIIEAPWDIYTHGFMLIAIYQLYLLFEKSKNYYQHTLIAGLFFGFSILSKGPISFYALLLPFIIAYCFIFKIKHIKSKLFSLVSFLIVGLLVGGWWYLYVRLADPETFIAITSKETGNWSSYNVRPFYYYWSFFTQSGLWTIPAFIGLLYPYMKSRVRDLKAYQFTLLWTLSALVLLSIIPEKKSRYLMPVLIPLALNTGFYIEYLFRRFKDLKNTKERLPVYFHFGLIALIGLAFAVVGYLFLKDVEHVNWLQFGIASVVLFTTGLMIFLFLLKRKIAHVFYMTIVFVIAICLFVAPLSSSLKGEAYTSIENLKTEAQAEGLTIYGLNYISPEMIWQFGDKISFIKQDDGSLKFPEEKKFGLLANGIKPEDQALLQSKYKIEEISTYDLNVANQDSRSYKERLKSTYYQLTKQ